MGTLLGNMVALEEYRQPSIWRTSQLHPVSCFWCFTFGVCELVEILLWRCPLFLNIWLICMATLKETKRTISVFLDCIYSLMFVFLTWCVLSAFSCLGSSLRTPGGWSEEDNTQGSSGDWRLHSADAWQATPETRWSLPCQSRVGVLRGEGKTGAVSWWFGSGRGFGLLLVWNVSQFSRRGCGRGPILVPVQNSALENCVYKLCCLLISWGPQGGEV